MESIKHLLRARNRKSEEMLANWEPGQRVQAYRDQSRDQIITTYRDLLTKTKADVARKREEIKTKHTPAVLDSEERTRLLIRSAALDSASLEREAKAILANPDLPVSPERGFVLAKELRARSGKQNIELADSLAAHTIQRLEQPWIVTDEWQRLKAMNDRLDTFAANSTSFVVLDLSSSPRRGSIIDVAAFDEYTGE